jgi:hypothetical protein
MIRLLLAAAAALALTAASPALACENCKDCPHKMAQADTKPGDKKDEKAAAVPCPCSGNAQNKECKCGPNCHCPHCHAKAEQKPEKKS